MSERTCVSVCVCGGVGGGYLKIGAGKDVVHEKNLFFYVDFLFFTTADFV